MATSSNLNPCWPSVMFTVRRCEPHLIPPAKPTPHEIKPLSDIDDQKGLRFHVPVIQFYKRRINISNDVVDPAKVIRAALAEALVYYYPFAGRLREVGPTRKLVVECTGEGLMFLEADADVTLEEYQEFFQPPFPCFDELLFDVPGTSGVINCPLILVQVTRLRCGGFILALRLNHAMSDAAGLFQFMNAVAEISRGQTQLSVKPVWERHLLDARVPPRLTCIHTGYEDGVVPGFSELRHDRTLVQRCFIFGPREIFQLKRSLPPHLRRCSALEVVIARIWQYRTIALQPDPDEEVRLICTVNVRSKFTPPLPTGYYGNAFAFSVAVSTANNISTNPLSYVLGLITKAKAEVTEEHMKSLADLMVLRGRPHISLARSYVVSDTTRCGLDQVDYGWGKPVYGGPATGEVESNRGGGSFLIRCMTAKGDKGIMVPVCLPRIAMDRFNEMMENPSAVPHVFSSL